MTGTPIADLVEARLPLVSLQQCGVEGDVEVVRVAARHLVDLCRFLTIDADAAYDLVDVTALDRGPEQRPRFTLLVALVSRTHLSRARLEVPVDDEDATFPSLSTLWPAALIYEREVLDFFGLLAEGHPQPQRLLLPEGFVGHPLRVDHPIGKYQPQVPPPASSPERIGGS